MPIEKIIVLEDDLIIRKNLEQQLRARRYDVAAAPTLAAAQEYLAKDTWDLVIADVRLPDGEATSLLRELQSRPTRPLVIMMSGYGSVESAVECMRGGAFDYLIKPFSNEQLEVCIQKAEDFTRLVKVNAYLNQEEDAETGYELLGHSPAMEQLRALLRKVARTQATVLIQGESGTGKELVARALHKQSPRAAAPFIKVNCAAVPENLIESEFFGHEKGAFTGAMNKREGRFELAHGGTILLDEVSEISPQVQAKLLRVLQERELERVGGNRTIKVDVRVLATTNRHLEQSVERKEFRQDLFFRLNVVPVHVPALRDRRADIPFLAEQFMHRFVRKHGVRVAGFSKECLAALAAHDWPGNVRELQNVIERAVILCGDGEPLGPDHLGLGGVVAPVTAAGTPSATDSAGAPAASGAQPGPDADGQFPTLGELEKRHIFAALARCNDNRTHAAKLLDISIRTLRNKLNEYAGKTGADTDGEGE
ncbi:MAG: two-component system NtrC family response regulator HydG [Limisphaerales bacterium]|nr:MAG: two-component system NtrC family response regulator HydG [Limisphaerales bacterium]TXT45899.1 MAG: two-component system NtrC family response regulator HydG [Limisphaerales bacterium]